MREFYYLPHFIWTASFQKNPFFFAEGKHTAEAEITCQEDHSQKNNVTAFVKVSLTMQAHFSCLGKNNKPLAGMLTISPICLHKDAVSFS